MTNLKDKRSNIEKNALRLREDCVFTSKNNFLYGSKLNKWRYTLGLISTAAAGMIVLSVSTQLEPSNLIVPISSIVALLSSAAITTLNPGKNSETHQRIGNDYVALQKKVQILIDIDIPDETLTDSDLREKLDKLNEEQQLLYRQYTNEVLPEWVHKKVKKKIASSESTYEVDNKI
jgi:hypothetical protein